MDVHAYTPDDASVPEGEVVVDRASTAQDLGPKLNRTAADVVRFLMQQGEMVTATQSLSDDMIELFAAELGAEIRMVDPGEEQEVEILKLLDVVDDLDETAIETTIGALLKYREDQDRLRSRGFGELVGLLRGA